ncbi:MAG: Clp protease N-terminal domain-containing protein, partial [Flavobacterium sp.]
MDDNFSQEVKDVISYSKDEAIRLSHDSIGTEHLLLGLLKVEQGEASNILNNLDIDIDFLRHKIETLNPASHNKELLNNKVQLHLTKQAERALRLTYLEVKLFKNDEINSVHLLLCILKNSDDPTTQILNKMKVDYDSVKQEYINTKDSESNAS